MKTLIVSLLILTQLLPQTSLAEVQIKANRTGLVVIGSQSKQLNLLSNGSPLQTSKGIYFSGQQLDQEKQKVYVVAFLSNDMQQEQYWPFERPLSAPFEYKNNVYVMDVDGQTYHQKGDHWLKASWRFPRYSEIISTEKSLLVCYSRSPLWNGPERGGCTAPEKDWTIAIDWLMISPQICNDKLRIRRFTEKPPFMLVQYKLDTGEKEAEKIVGDDTYDLCAVKFD